MQALWLVAGGGYMMTASFRRVCEAHRQERMPRVDRMWIGDQLKREDAAMKTRREIVGLCVLLVSLCLLSGCNETDKKVAFVHNTVLSHLVCPATARFADGDSNRIDNFEEGFQLESYVDAKNRLGATVRMKYDAIVSDKSNREMLFLVLEGEIVETGFDVGKLAEAIKNR